MTVARGERPSGGLPAAIGEDLAVTYCANTIGSLRAVHCVRSSPVSKQLEIGAHMSDPTPPDHVSPRDPAVKSATGGWVRLWGRLKRFRGPIAAVAGLGAVLSGLLGYWSAYRTVEEIVAPKAAPAVLAADARPFSIVVLPFTNLTGDANQAYVADGLTASLTADLFRIRDAFIVSAATAFAYKDRPVNVQQVGKDLGVRFVLQGSVQRSGTKIRINAQLADAISNAQLWSESFDGDQSDLFALQDQITTRIAYSIGYEMIVVAARESEIRRSVPQASDLMLRAKALEQRPQSLKRWQQIEVLYRQALKVDPNNVRAMIGLASSLTLQASNFDSEMANDVKEAKYAEGHELALKAKEIDPHDPDIYIAIQNFAMNHDDYEGALRAAEIRLSLEPRKPLAYNDLAIAYFYIGEPGRTIELLTQAIKLDRRHSPNDFFLMNMGRAYFMLGDNDAAIEWLLKSLERESKFPVKHGYLAMAYALKGQDSKARAAVADMRRLDPGFKLLSWEKPGQSAPAAFKEWYETKLIPASRKAELPE